MEHGSHGYQLSPDRILVVRGTGKEELFKAVAGAGLTVALLRALTEKRIQASDVIINVYGSHDPDALDTLQVTDVAAAFRLYFAASRELSLA